jgi:HSP20 family protein
MFGKFALKREEPNAQVASSPTVNHLDRPSRTPAVTIRETEEAILIDTDLPGVKADQLHLSVNQGILTMHGTVTVGERNGFRRLHQEYEEADFHLAFTLPDHVDTNGISASSNHGVVTITLPKVKAAQPRRIAVAST